MSPDAGDAALRMLRALEKLPPVTDIVFHGLPDVPDITEPRWTRGLTATSRDVRIATENFSTRAIAAVVCRTGRDISPFSTHPAEREVVLPPQAVLRTIVVDTAPDGQTPLIIIEQLAPLDPAARLPPTVEALVDEVRGRLREAAASAPVEVTTRGKFTEPLYFED